MRGKQQMADAFVEGGWLERQRFRDVLQGAGESLRPAFEATVYAQYVHVIDQCLRDRRDLERVEQQVNRIQFDYLSQARYVTFGAEPIVAYYHGRSEELRNVRRTLLARASNMSFESIRERIDAPWVAESR